MLSQLLLDTMTTIYSGEADVISKGISYLRIVSLSFIFQGLSPITIIVGTAMVPFFTSLASFYVNVFFNYVLIFGSLCALVLRIQAAVLLSFYANHFMYYVSIES